MIVYGNLLTSSIQASRLNSSPPTPQPHQHTPFSLPAVYIEPTRTAELELSPYDHQKPMKKNVVLYPGLGVGHLIPMMELADVLLNHGFAVAVALIDDPMCTPTVAATFKRVVASRPSVSFHMLPPEPLSSSLASGEHFLVRYLGLIRQLNNQLRELLCSAPLQPVNALVIDMFSVDALDVAKELGIPAYTFFPSGAGALAVHLQLPSLHAKSQATFKELGDTLLEFFGVPPIPASHLPLEMLENPESKIYKAVMDVWNRIPESNGILVNTFESLESRAVQAIRDPRRLPGSVLPPVYCVGPLVKKKHGETDEGAERHSCLAWLDGQPDRNVVFLCFGSEGEHQEQQLKEMASGLEKSGHRFLWVVRAPRNDPKNFFVPRAEPDLEALLPDGFLERTKGRGLVVKSWAPQVDVLRHRATGAFVTHCGWNSVLEAITAGVPMLCWPLYAEQKTNKVLLVEEMRAAVAVETKMCSHGGDGLVGADEVEAKVTLVMESEQGRELRERVAVHSKGAAMAWADGGSSGAAFVQFLSDVQNKNLGRRI